MSILCRAASLPAPEKTPHPLGPEHQPIYSAEPELARPQSLASHQQIEALAAILHAKARYPGAVAAVLVDALEAYKDLGYLAQPSAPVARLIRELMAPPA